MVVKRISDSPIPVAGLRPHEAARVLGRSMASLYRDVNAGELELRKVGPRASLITRQSLVDYLSARGIPVPPGL